MGKMKFVFTILLLLGIATNACFAQESISIASNQNGLVQYDAKFAVANTHLFVLYGDGHFGTQQQPLHHFAPDAQGYDTEAYFARGYHPNLPTKKMVSTGPVTSGNTYVNPPVNINGEVDILTSWAMAPTYETFLILAFRNTQSLNAVNGCLEILLNGNDLVLNNNGIKEYNNWVSNRSVHSGNFGPYNRKIEWDFNNLAYQETRFVYIPVVTQTSVGKTISVRANLNVGCIAESKLIKTREANLMVRTYPHDPNFKIVDAECLDHHSDKQQLTYTIGFFNDGQNFATNVALDDELSYLLDPTSFSLESYEYLPHVILNGHQLRLSWNNINLPGTNQTFPKTYSYEEASTFVSFSICTLPILEVGDCIENLAKITFDHQSPFYTGTAVVCVTEICETAKSCSDTREAYNDQNQTAPLFQVHPNPFDDRINLRWTEQASGTCQVDLLDFSGKKVRQLYEGTVEYLPKSFDLSDLSNGIYLLSISSENEILTQKIIKQ